MQIKAVYISVDEEELEYLLSLQEQSLKSEFIVKQNKTQKIDIDVYWDILHFVLTSQSALNPPDLNDLSALIIGNLPFLSDSEDYIAYNTKDEVKAIFKTLSEVNIYDKTINLSIETIIENELYPTNLKDYKTGYDRVLKEEVRESFDKLKEFYKNANDEDKVVVVGVF